jgi:hypothetical protein
MTTRKMQLVVGVLLIANLWLSTPLSGQDSAEAHQEQGSKTDTAEEPDWSELALKIALARFEREKNKRTQDNLKNRNEFMRGLMRGIDQTQATYHGGIGMMTSMMGDERSARSRFEKYQDEMEEASENPRLAPTFEDMIDDPFGWLAATAGEYALLTLFCTVIFAGVFLWIAKQRSKNETVQNSERGITMLDRKETFFWIRVIEDDKVVYTYRNYRTFYFCIFPLLIILTGIPVIGLVPIIGWIFYWGVYPRPNREISQLLKEAQCVSTGSKFSAENPMRLTVSRTDFDRIVMDSRERTTTVTTQSSLTPAMPSNRSEIRSTDTEFEALKKKNEELKRKIEAKKLAEKRAKERAALEAENARLMAELGEGMEIDSAESESDRKRP